MKYVVWTEPFSVDCKSVVFMQMSDEDVVHYMRTREGLTEVQKQIVDNTTDDELFDEFCAVRWGRMFEDPEVLK